MFGAVPFLLCIFFFVIIYVYSVFGSLDIGSNKGLAIWIFVPVIVEWGVTSNFGQIYGNAAVILTVGLLLAYCCYRPNSSELKWALLSGLKAPASFVLFICLLIPGVRFIYAVLSGELRREGWAGLPLDWMSYFILPVLISAAILVFVIWIRNFGFRQQATEDMRRESRANSRTRPDEDSCDGRSSYQEDNIKQEDGLWWEVLDLTPTATWEDVKQSALALRKRYHPDAMAHTPRFRDEAERQTKLINRAVDDAKIHFGQRSAA